MRFYTTVQLGDKQFVTPEGFLVIYDVPIARTGAQLYAPEEFAAQGHTLEAAEDGLVYVDRPAEEVFREETIASVNGKAIVDNHPAKDVTPENWRHLTMGVHLNARRSGDMLLADFVVFDTYAIDLIRRQGKREVSCGYNADYYKVEGRRGWYEQRNIIVNHTALVDHARCGAQCSIGDALTVRTTDCAGGRTIMKWKDAMAKLGDLLKGKDVEKEVTAVLTAVKVVDEDEAAPGGEGGHHVHVHTGGEEGGRTKYTDEALDTKFGEYDGKHAAHDAKHATHDADISAIKKHLGMDDSSEQHEIEGALKEEAPVGTNDTAFAAAMRSNDSAFLREAYQRTVSTAEVLVPGIRLAAFDSAVRPPVAYRAICDSRRKVLQFAVHDSALRVLLDGIRGGVALTEQGIASMKCTQVRDTFFALGEARRRGNNVAVSSSVTSHAAAIEPVKGIRTLADLNKTKNEYYKTH